VQNPVYIGQHNEPQPDLLLLHPRDDFYESRHPRPEDVYLLIEVSDSTLLTDREEKLPIYAKGGIPEVWIVNLPERVIEVYTAPVAGEYTVSRRVLGGDPLAPSAFPDAAIDTATLLHSKA
jgi:Uma2 family endonuclease